MGIRGVQVATLAMILLLQGGSGGVAAPDSQPPEIMLYAAASLRESLQDLAPTCDKQAGARLVFNFGPSSDLAHQIEAAEKADLFFSADEAWMDRLSKAGLLEADTRRTVLSNRLVVIAPLDSTLVIHSAADLAGKAVRRLSLANPESVPAGKYARAWLEKAGQWEAVKDKVVPGVDVRAALSAVESGVVEAGIVYATDAAISRKVRVLLEVPTSEAPAISYPLAILRNRPRKSLAAKVEDCLTGPEAREVYQSRGFIVRPASP
jgi:molybdate transport system substrate-binding protein